jgi:hypothetical protein
MRCLLIDCSTPTGEQALSCGRHSLPARVYIMCPLEYIRWFLPQGLYTIAARYASAATEFIAHR